MAVSIMLTSCGKSAGLSNSDKRAGNKTSLAGADKKNLPQNTKGFWHTATNFVRDHKAGVFVGTIVSLIVLSLTYYYWDNILGLFKKNGTTSLPPHTPSGDQDQDQTERQLYTIDQYKQHLNKTTADLATANDKLKTASNYIRQLEQERTQYNKDNSSSLKERLEQALKDTDDLGKKFNQANSNVNKLIKERSNLDKDNQTLSADLKQSKQEAKNLFDQNALLQNQILQLQDQIKRLTQQAPKPLIKKYRSSSIPPPSEKLPKIIPDPHSEKPPEALPENISENKT